MRIKKLILHAYVQIPGLHNGEMKEQLIDFDANVNQHGVLIDVDGKVPGVASFKLGDGEAMEALIPWSQVKVLYRVKEPKKT